MTTALHIFCYIWNSYLIIETKRYDNDITFCFVGFIVENEFAKPFKQPFCLKFRQGLNLKRKHDLKKLIKTQLKSGLDKQKRT